MTPTMHFRFIDQRLFQFWKKGPCDGDWFRVEEIPSRDNDAFDPPEEWLKQELERV